jgi:3-hydroxyisobutyrate dehydrogenase-like beta-hydroxyacid dehydrogenase
MIQEGLAEFDSQKFYLARGNFLRMLCETQALAGRLGDAFATVEQALQTSPDELIYRPYLLRLRGELRVKSDSGGKANFELAAQDFHEAIELAQSMGAKSLELRATTSLARLLAQRGLSDEAHTILADIYNWFTEGFDTADLKDAKELLDELAG